MADSAGHDPLMPPTRIDPATIQFDLRDAIRKLLRLYGLEQKDIASRAQLSTATVSDYLNDKVTTAGANIEAILTSLRVTRAEMDALVRRMNGEAPGPPRQPNTRAEDHDPRLRDALQLGRQIAELPSDARNVLFHLIRVLEGAYRDRRASH